MSTKSRGLMASAALCAVLVVGQRAAAATVGRRQAGQSDTAQLTVAQLFDMVDEIDHLNVLNPLKLTADQIDKLTAAIQAADADYQQRLEAIGADFRQRNSADTLDLKKRMLAGGSIPQDYKKRIVELLGRRDAIQGTEVTSLVANVRTIFTDTQLQIAIGLARDTKQQATPGAKGTDAQWLNLYVLGEFLRYDRILPLLKEMKAAAGG